jgi:hypothetical protein
VLNISCLRNISGFCLRAQKGHLSCSDIVDYFICQAEFLGTAGSDDAAQADCGGAMPGKEAVKEWQLRAAIETAV